MKRFMIPLMLGFAGLSASPALADSAIDTPSMLESASPAPSVNAENLPIDGFDLSGLQPASPAGFMATMSASYQPGYRLKNTASEEFVGDRGGVVSAIVSPEFAYRSTAQDSGVDAVLPGRFISNSVRGDYLPDTGPAASDKSSIGLRFGF